MNCEMPYKCFEHEDNTFYSLTFLLVTNNKVRGILGKYFL